MFLILMLVVVEAMEVYEVVVVEKEEWEVVVAV